MQVNENEQIIDVTVLDINPDNPYDMTNIYMDVLEHYFDEQEIGDIVE